MNCFITEQYELQGELTATLDHIDPYECLAYVNISGCYNPFREQQDSIPYQVWCNDREIIADSCRWIENVRPSGFVERYYQCSIELNTGETLADLDIMSSLAPEDTLNYQIPNFSCNDDLCENIIIMPNPNNGIFDVQILQVLSLIHI